MTRGRRDTIWAAGAAGPGPRLPGAALPRPRGVLLSLALAVAVVGAADALPHYLRLVDVTGDERAARAGLLLLALLGGMLLAALLAGADAAVVAVPTVAHFEVVDALLGAGLDVLVEKPIAASLDEARALMARARAGGCVLRARGRPRGGSSRPHAWPGSPTGRCRTATSPRPSARVPA